MTVVTLAATAIAIAIAIAFVELVVRRPSVGIPLVLFFAAILVIGTLARQDARRDRRRIEPTSGVHAPSPLVSLDVVRNVAPHFSRVVFEDFLYSLYAEVHRARGMNALGRLSAYLSPQVISQLEQATRGPAESVIVGAMRVLDASASPPNRRTRRDRARKQLHGGGPRLLRRGALDLTRQPAARSRTPARS